MLIDEICTNNYTIQILGRIETYRYMKHNEKCFNLTGKPTICVTYVQRTFRVEL